MRWLWFLKGDSDSLRQFIPIALKKEKICVVQYDGGGRNLVAFTFAFYLGPRQFFLSWISTHKISEDSKLFDSFQ